MSDRKSSSKKHQQRNKNGSQHRTARDERQSSSTADPLPSTTPSSYLRGGNLTISESDQQRNQQGGGYSTSVPTSDFAESDRSSTAYQNQYAYSNPLLGQWTGYQAQSTGNSSAWSPGDTTASGGRPPWASETFPSRGPSVQLAANRSIYSTDSSQLNLYDADDNEPSQAYEEAPRPGAVAPEFQSQSESNNDLANDESRNNPLDFGYPSEDSNCLDGTVSSAVSAFVRESSHHPSQEEQRGFSRASYWEAPSSHSNMMASNASTDAGEAVQKLSNLKITGSLGESQGQLQQKRSEGSAATKGGGKGVVPRNDKPRFSSGGNGPPKHHRRSSDKRHEAGRPSASNQGMNIGERSETKHRDGKFYLEKKASRSDTLGPEFVVCPSRDFRVGRVLKILWSEPSNSDSKVANTAQTSVTSSLYGELVYSGIRRFAIAVAWDGHAVCLPILTYGGQGTLKGGAKSRDHAIIYIGPFEPKALEGENLVKKAIQMTPFTPDQKLKSESRINYKKHYTIEHNIKVNFIGEIHEDSMSTFINDFKNSCYT